MSEGTSEETIPEQQYVTGTLGQPLNIILEGETDVPPPGPGLVQMNAYDPAYLKILECGWYPAGELKANAAAFRLVVMPLIVGHTHVAFTIQPRAINPLFQPITFHVTINPS